jgi:ketosteroid isomerase-like protein
MRSARRREWRATPHIGGRGATRAVLDTAAMTAVDADRAHELFGDWFAFGNRAMSREIDLDGTEAEGFGEDMWADDVVYQEDASWPGSDTYRGREAVASRFREYLEIFGPGSRLELQEVLDAGERVVVVFQLRLASAASGVAVEQPWAYVARIEDGRVAEMRAFQKVDEALASVGLA